MKITNIFLSWLLIFQLTIPAHAQSSQQCQGPKPINSPAYDALFEKIMAVEFTLSVNESAKLDRTQITTWLRFFVGQYLRDERRKIIKDYNDKLNVLKGREQQILAINSSEEVATQGGSISYNGESYTNQEFIAKKNQLAQELARDAYNLTREFYSNMYNLVTEAERRFRISYLNWAWLIRKDVEGDEPKQHPGGNGDAEGAKYNWIGADLPEFRDVMMDVGNIHRKLPGFSKVKGSDNAGYHTICGADRVYRSLMYANYYVENMQNEYRQDIQGDKLTKDYLKIDLNHVDEKYFDGRHQDNFNDYYFFNFFLPYMKFDSFGSYHESKEAILAAWFTGPAFGIAAIAIKACGGDPMREGDQGRIVPAKTFVDIKTKGYPLSFTRYLKEYYVPTPDKNEVGESTNLFGPELSGLKRSCIAELKNLTEITEPAFKQKCPKVQQFIERVSKYGWAQSFTFSASRQWNLQYSKKSAEQMLIAASSDYQEHSRRHLYYEAVLKHFSEIKSTLEDKVTNYNRLASCTMNVADTVGGMILPPGVTDYSITSSDNPNGGERAAVNQKESKLSGLNPGGIAGGGGQNMGSLSAKLGDSNVKGDTLGSTQFGSANTGNLKAFKNRVIKEDAGATNTEAAVNSNQALPGSSEATLPGASGSLGRSGGSGIGGVPSPNANAGEVQVAAIKPGLNSNLDNEDMSSGFGRDGGGFGAGSSPYGSMGSLEAESVTGLGVGPEKEILTQSQKANIQIKEDDSIFTVVSKTYIKSLSRILIPKSKIQSNSQPLENKKSNDKTAEDAVNLLK